MKWCGIAAMAAGLAFPALAFAQDQDPAGEVFRVAPVIYLDGSRPYDERAISAVWDNWTNLPTATVRALYNRSLLVEDINFNPGPWAASPTGTATISTIGFGVALNGLAPTQQFIIKIDFYDTFNGAAPALSNVYGGTLIGTYTSPAITVSNTNTGGVILRYSVGASIGPFPDNNCAAVITLIDPATGLKFPEPVATSRVQMAVCNSLALTGHVGGTNTSVYRDNNNNGFVEGSEGTILTGVPSPVAYVLKMDADLPAPPPTCNDTLGSLADGLTVRNNVTATGTRWYCLSLAGGALDQNLTFLDIDTEGSTSNMAIALYSDTGDLLAKDEDSGSGTNAQLSFGVGRRAAVGDGLQYDGRNYDPRATGGSVFGLNPGSYYLAVAPTGATFAGGFGVTAASTSNTYNVHLNTNVNGTPAPASVPPVVDEDLGTILTATPSTPIVLNAQQQAWIKFTTCTDAVDPSSFLDIDSSASADIYAEWFVFDANGNLVTADANSGAGNRPQISFGQVSPERPAAGDGLTFAGQDGNLPAGTYYLAMAYDFVTGVPAAGTDGHFHVRPVGGSSGFSYEADFIPSWTACGAAPCDPDVNQDGNANQDDVAYLVNVVGGGDNPTGIDPDFNHDGNVDQSDIAALVDVVAGGPCP